MQSFSQLINTNKRTSNFFTAGCPSCRPTNIVQALKGKHSGIMVKVIVIIIIIIIQTFVRHTMSALKAESDVLAVASWVGIIMGVTV